MYKVLLNIVDSQIEIGLEMRQQGLGDSKFRDAFQKFIILVVDDPLAKQLVVLACGGG